MTKDTVRTITGLAKDGTEFPIEKLRAHQDGTLHRAVSVFLISDRGLLIQKRAIGKYHSGGLWANSVCSHPDWGEAVADCAVRRCAEELNLSVALEPMGEVTYHADVGNGLIEHEHVFLFAGRCPETADQIAPNPAEVAATRWVGFDALTQEIERAPDTFTAWFQLYMVRNDSVLTQLRQQIWAIAQR